MNKNMVIGMAFSIAAVLFVVMMNSAVGEVLAKLVGKAAWYLLYAMVIGAVRSFALGFTARAPKAVAAF